jgi:hypothetical protein
MSYYKEKNINMYKKQIFFISLAFRWFCVRNLKQMSLISDSRPYFNLATRQMHLAGDHK